jgi:hypothetical protein
VVRRITSLTSELRQPYGIYRTHHSKRFKPAPSAARMAQDGRGGLR